VVDEDDLDRLKDLISDAPVIRAVNRLIARAVELNASDIHVEPAEDRLSVRFRIDGVLQEEPNLPAAMRSPFVSRVKIMAGLNIAERRLPQDGRMRIPVRGNEIDLRVATAPSIHGESVVMRILDKSNIQLDFAALGFDEELVARLRQALQKPYGIVLVTGPTGSGKTTSLYAALAELNRGSVKLLTIEDPIEYRLPGIIQAQVNPTIGFTFAAALRSFLRQDPDVMMVGEIRDSETAAIAVQAALTGHMILSTLHTNTAAGAVTRLLDMGVEPFLLSSVLTAVAAQRLVRRLCPSCSESYEPDKSVFASFGVHPFRTDFRRATGCKQCGGSGFKGRLAITELLVVDDELARLILRGADTREIAAAARAAGTRDLPLDGFMKAGAGLTTIEEVLRVASQS
jgi:general secretion pathway protein E